LALAPQPIAKPYFGWTSPGESMSPTAASDDLAEVIGTAYESALEPDQWPRFLARLAHVSNAEHASIALASPTDSRVSVAVLHNHDPAEVARWRDEFGGYDPFFERIRGKACGRLFHSMAEIPRAEFRATEVYVQCFEPADIDDALATFLSHGPAGTDLLSLQRSPQAGPFDTESIACFRNVIPHLMRAVAIHYKVFAFSWAKEAAEAAFDLLACGLITVAANGIILDVNREAERILRESDGVASRANRLETSDREAGRRLDEAIGQAVSAALERSESGATALAIRRPSRKRSYEVLVAPIAPRPRERVFGFLSRAPIALVLITDPEAAPAPAIAVLQRLHSLTPSLARLAAALATGKTIAEYAAEAHVTEGTARQQLKELFARTRTRRQAELVALLLRGIGQFRI